MEGVGLTLLPVDTEAWKGYDLPQVVGMSMAASKMKPKMFSLPLSFLHQLGIHAERGVCVCGCGGGGG